MFDSIRSAGKSVIGKARDMWDAIKALPANWREHGSAVEELMRSGDRPATARPLLLAVQTGRCRISDSNREWRLKAGLPHGTSGAKLIRRAAEGRIGKP